MKVFDTSPKGFLNLSPGFWSIPLWKSGIFMHHNVEVLQQVKCNITLTFWASFYLITSSSLSKGFAMDPELSDLEESIHSQSDTESDGDVENDSDVAEEPIQESKTGIYMYIPFRTL